jgi:uncharacterized protein (TIGR02996 family)
MYFERHGGKPRFVELQSDGLEVMVRSGPLGRMGRRSSLSFRTASEVEAWKVRQVERLEKRGYWPGHHQLELLSVLRADPEDEGAYQVYADWLLERRDVRGELVAAQLAGDGPRSAALLESHPVELLPAWWVEHGIELAWSMGFVHTMRITATSFWYTHVESHLRRLFQHPSAHLVRQLVVPPGALARFQRTCWTLAPPTLQTLRTP